MPRLATSRRQAAGCAPLPSAHTGSRYARHAPERTLLYALVEAHYPDFIVRIEAEGRSLPGYVREAFDAYLRCGVLEHGFLRVVCEHCRAERLVAYFCKKRGLCPSCGARRMAESARHLVDEVFGPRPVRQWVLSFPYPLRFLFASKPEAIGPVLGIVQRVIAGWLADQAGIDRASAQCGAVTLIQRFGSALNLNVHFHMLWLDGVYVEATELPRTAQFDLTLDTYESGDALSASLIYATSLFERSTVERLAAHWRNLLEAICREPARRVGELPLLDRSERDLLLARWDQTGEDYPSRPFVHQLVAEQARRAPEAIAVLFGEQRLSYGELDSQANRLAQRLVELGVGPEVRVAIAMRRSAEIMVAFLAVLKAGGAYVPLDIAYPAPRRPSR
ncbi:protein PvdI(3) [Pseudomonas aeruginosa PA38182]|nr:protein PvdI(3) [Pseudomonas aeruginosa PA38182]